MAKKEKSKEKTREKARELKRKAIEACRNSSGQILPRAVWHAARDAKNVLHNEFEWDLTKAAEQAWDQRAKELIREVRFEIIVDDLKIIAPFYCSDPTADESAYIPTARIARKQSWSQSTLLDELQRIEGGINRARNLALVFGMEAEFERLLENLVAVRKRIAAKLEANEEARPQA